MPLIKVIRAQWGVPCSIFMQQNLCKLTSKIWNTPNQCSCDCGWSGFWEKESQGWRRRGGCLFPGVCACDGLVSTNGRASSGGLGQHEKIIPEKIQKGYDCWILPIAGYSYARASGWADSVWPSRTYVTATSKHQPTIRMHDRRTKAIIIRNHL